MANLTIRNLDDEVVAKLKARAIRRVGPPSLGLLAMTAPP
jgi:hypothetical protein